MGEINLKLSYTPQQKEVFFANQKRFTTIEKGRRFGFTKGIANACIEWLLEDKKILWVDTINSNLKRYFERYFRPELKQLPKEMWSFNAQDKQLNINTAWLDMRSAERPENIEGFGYDIVILNEAGIILKDPYLWDNAIRPMLLDNPSSRAFIGGVPKGKNKFYELASRGMKDDKEWINYQFSSYDNPLLKREEVDKMVDELGGIGSDVVRQEIYGEFLDTTTNSLFPLSIIENSFSSEWQYNPSTFGIWGLDVARDGDDESVLCIREGYRVKSFDGFRIQSTTELAREIYSRYERAEIKPTTIFIDTIGVGAGVYDLLCDLGLRGVVREAKASFKSIDERQYANKRAEMFFRLKDKFHLISMDANEKIKKQLQMIEFSYDSKGRYLIIPKETIKKTYGTSPDYADALALTFFDVIQLNHIHNRERNYATNSGW